MMENPEKSEIICVDLDYTLISTDILIEQIVHFVKQNPLRILLVLFWWLKSKQYLKQKLTELVEINYQTLPFRREVVEFISKAKQKNSTIVLVTAANQQIADKVNATVNLFDEVFGSQISRNLKGKNKAKFLSEKYGKKQFDYIGDSVNDLPLWKISRKAFLASNSNLMNFVVGRKPNFAGNLLLYRTQLKDFLILLRIHQWIKNLLIFLPLLLAHQFQNTFALHNSLLAFVAFSFLASALYIFNDIVDLENDRNHPTKRNRPIASGIFSVYTSFTISIFLLFFAFIISTQINSFFALVCIIYFFLNMIYSFWMKQIPIVDIFLLSLFYVIRLYAGSVASNIPISNWLLAFSMFFFLSLATYKRFADLKLTANQEHKIGRPYDRDSLHFFQTFGIGSSFASIIVFILYINSEKVLELYNHPSFLWVDAFLLLLWMMLIWNLANKGKVNFDPVLIAIKNPYLILLEITMVLVWILSIII